MPGCSFTLLPVKHRVQGSKAFWKLGTSPRYLLLWALEELLRWGPSGSRLTANSSQLLAGTLQHFSSLRCTVVVHKLGWALLLAGRTNLLIKKGLRFGNNYLSTHWGLADGSTPPGLPRLSSFPRLPPLQERESSAHCPGALTVYCPW